MIAGYHLTAPNGFVNGMGDESEQNEDDAYPEEGPLFSGAQSLRRIPNSRSPLVSIIIYTLQIYHFIITILLTVYQLLQFTS